MSSSDRPDSSYNYLKIAAIIVDALHWCMTAAFLCICIWVTVDAQANFLSGSTSVLYCSLATSCLMFLAATTLLIGLAADSKDIVSSYVGMMCLVFILQIGLLSTMAFLFELKRGMIEKLWFEVGFYWKDLTQSSLQCCGYHESAEYVPMRASCLRENGTVYTETCADAIVEYFASPQPHAQLVSCLILPALLQIAAFCLAVVILKKLAKRPSGDEKWNNGPPRVNKNQVQPIMMAPLAGNNAAQGGMAQTPVSRDQVNIGEGSRTPYTSQQQPSNQPSTSKAGQDGSDKTAKEKINPLLNVASALLTMQGGSQ